MIFKLDERKQEAEYAALFRPTLADASTHSGDQSRSGERLTACQHEHAINRIIGR